MSVANFWDRHELSWRELPTLQELLRTCDKDRLIQTVMSDHVLRAGTEDTASRKRKRSREKRLAGALDAMNSLAIKKKRNHAKVLLPEESFIVHAHSGLIERKLSASLTTVDNAFAAQHAIDTWKSHDAHIGDFVWPQTIGYALEPWEKTLAARVWLGGSWCCRERYLVLASAFWEMTYYGFEYNRVVAGQMRARAQASLYQNEQAGSKVPATVSELSQQRAVAFGLAVPDAFREDYDNCVAARVGELNDAARLDYWCRLIDLSHRLGRTDSSKAA